MKTDADISAVTIDSILKKSTRKDFFVLYELLQKYPLEQLIAWYFEKYPSQMLAISIPNAITYFTDADDSEEPLSFKNQTWEGVKRGIQKAVRDYLI